MKDRGTRTKAVEVIIKNRESQIVEMLTPMNRKHWTGGSRS